MPVTLHKDLRNQLSHDTLKARVAAEAAAKAALEMLAVHEAGPREHMSEEQRKLRNRLRARGRALGDALHADKTQEIDHLVELVAYEAWHRLLFTRFLTENNLLRTDPANGSVPVSLQECDELAAKMGAPNGFALACRFAQTILPGVFRADDPALELRLAIDDEVALRGLLNAIPEEVFHADDSLGWTYQFWQEQKKEEINESGVKIGATELSPVTQLFTEDYMVEFLLHNTLGAWWAGKLNPIQAETEAEARAQVALVEQDGLGINWTYLRFIQDAANQTWSPAAGTFPGWPRTAREITFLDPCMGSGHFLVFGLPLLARLRMEEEGLGAAEAVVATLNDNIHGLELDERCAQIAAFNVALAAWKLAGFQPLPDLHLACSGLAPHATVEEWTALAQGDLKLVNGMTHLHGLFRDAPVLGSLINPRADDGHLLVARFHELEPLLNRALARESNDMAHEQAIATQGLAKAAELLGREFTLVATNVPYLGRGKQGEVLKQYIETHYSIAKADLATVFVQRCLELCQASGSTALVTPQNWLFLTSYKKLREELLKTREWDFVARLGARAFETIGGEVVNVALLVMGAFNPVKDHSMAGLDVSEAKSPAEKANRLANHVPTSVKVLEQAGQLGNPDARIGIDHNASATLLSNFVNIFNGICSGDYPRFGRFFWEISLQQGDWRFQQSTSDSLAPYSGRENVFWWQNGRGDFYNFVKERLGESQVYSWIRGAEAWGKQGVLISAMRLSASIYTGDLYDDNTVTLIPHDESHLAALWCFCTSDTFASMVREVEPALKVRGSIVKIPFDLTHWQAVATEKYPKGLPEPYSNEPTQWLFKGEISTSTNPLQVAVVRLLGYRWSDQSKDSLLIDPFADSDGIVCLSSIHREQPAAYRLRQLLSSALGTYDEKKLIQQASPKGSKTTSLEDWLRDEFFEHHCALFHHRPFIWHLWDGRKDGFSALVNYHKLDYSKLQKLTHTYLGEWIGVQRADAKADKPGAGERLAAAERLQHQLEAILVGEAPLDIFVRWKPIKEQALGWHPDLNNGVRLNIRPFMLAEDVGKKGAGILRAKPNIKWDKDRGKEPERPKAAYPWLWCADEPVKTDPQPGDEFTGHRWNQVHLSLQAKR